MSGTKLLVVEDDKALSEALVDTLSIAGYSVDTAADGKRALGMLENEVYDLVISDIQMPNMDGTALLKKITANNITIPVMLMTAYASVEQAVEAMRYGAVDYLVKPFEAEVLVNMVERYVGQAKNDFADIVAFDNASVDLFNLSRRIAENDVTVMVTGESGVGKEVVARFIHDNSARKEGPFVAINCAAIPENMLEATLFGYEKGAYTGAYKASPGKFEQANGGTLLLDEISEMDLGLQAKLLRVLQEKEVERLGGTSVIDLDVRVIATSNRNMQDYVKENKFREDLFYRLNVFPLAIKPLRERKGDIIPLAEKFLEKYARAQKIAIPSISDEAKQKLLDHNWPGNVRELDNVSQRALILHQNEIIVDNDVQFEIDTQKLNVDKINIPVANNITSLKEDNLVADVKNHEWKVILNTLSEVNGSRKDTADKLGISQRTLRYKLAKMRESGIRIPDSSGVEHA